MLSFLFSFNASAAPSVPIEVDMFSLAGCVHCAAMKQWINEFKQNDFPGIIFNEYELKSSAANRQKLMEYSKVYGFQTEGVPIIVIGDKYTIGEDKDGLTNNLRACQSGLCVNPSTKVEEYYKANPSERPTATAGTSSNTNETVGFIVLGVVVIAIIAVAVFSLKGSKGRKQ